MQMYCKKTFTLYKLGCYKEALEAYKKTIVIKPDYNGAWYNLRKCILGLTPLTALSLNLTPHLFGMQNEIKYLK